MSGKQKLQGYLLTVGIASAKPAFVPLQSLVSPSCIAQIIRPENGF